jgi:AraC-like DNA-binding protein
MSPRPPIRLPDAPTDAGTAPLPKNLLDAMADAGVDPAAIAGGIGLDAQRLEAGLSRVDADRFLCAAWNALGDPSFGLRAGVLVRPERLGVSGLAAMTSPSFGVALERKARYNRLVWGDAYEVRSDATAVTVTVVAGDESRPYGAAKIDMELASLLAFGRHFSGVAITPLGVCLRQAEPAYHERYAVVFGCPVVFDAPVNSIRFRAQDAALKLLSANGQVGGWLESAAESALTQLDATGLAARVRLELGRLLHDGEPTLAQMASTLCLSERTLQRRLTAEGLSFSRLLDDLRSESAQSKLGRGHSNVPELAYLLGFADANSFYRAFRRWTGTTPELFRRARPAGG